MRINYQNLWLKIWMNLEKLVPRCPTSSHRCIPIMIQRKALQARIWRMQNYEKCWPHPCICKVERIMNLLEDPQLKKKTEAVIIQKRGASALHTQAEHPRRESLMSNSSQEPTALNLLQCFDQVTRNRETNSRVLFSNTLIRQIWSNGLHNHGTPGSSFNDKMRPRHPFLFLIVDQLFPPHRIMSPCMSHCTYS